MNESEFLKRVKKVDFLNDKNVDLEKSFKDIQSGFRQLITDKDKWLQISVLLKPFMCSCQLSDYIGSILNTPTKYPLDNISQIKEVLCLFPETDGSLFYMDKRGIIHNANKWAMHILQTKIIKILEETNDKAANDYSTSILG